MSEIWHVGCLSRVLDVARSVEKTVFKFEVPLERKSPKTYQNRLLHGQIHIYVIFGLYLFTGIVNEKMVLTTLLATLRPLYRYPTCHTFDKLFFCPHKGVIDIFKSKRGCPNGVQIKSSFQIMIIYISAHKN